ncbi:uncharacterized protein LOC143431163 [Xylocopa sonorina]|uniref:uncharacterized protein LOC143431163 n=1 Tax=Xylocopa sonorina TaxID=1818115 RepID=UPI00403A8289
MNRKFLPPQTKQKQKRGDIISLQNRSGVKFLKWTDERPLCMLTISKSHNCAIIRGKDDKLKPDTVFSYNSAKKGVDISDQMCSYYNNLRKTVKWYQKVVVELICRTSLSENSPSDVLIVRRKIVAIAPPPTLRTIVLLLFAIVGYFHTKDPRER